MSETPQSLFDQLAEDYENMRQELDWDPFVHIQEAFKDIDLKGLNVLDAGCGTGECTRWFQRQGAKPYGLDISPEMCLCAAERSENIPYLNQDLSEPLPFDDDEFDAIVALGCLEYIENIGDTVAEFRRVLKAGGTFLGCFERCGEDCPDGCDKSVVFYEDWMRFRMTEDELRSMLSRHFSQFDIKRVHGFKLTDDDGNDTGEFTQYFRVIAKV